jgi:tetratricopeptide (TPR) repeat protein
VGGTGAGTFAFTNLRYRTTGLDETREPHSLPVQFLSETGFVGLVLLVGAVGSLIVAAKRRPGPELALALALPAWAVHSLVDIAWDFAAVSAPIFLVAGALAARPSGRGPLSPPALLVASGVALAAVCSLVALWLGDRWTGQAREALANPARAVTLAKRARSVNPLSVEPLFVQAWAEQSRRNYGEALGLLEEATRMQPENKDTWFNLGYFNLHVRNCPRAALPQLERFTSLDRQDPGNREYDRALALVNSGAPTC